MSKAAPQSLYTADDWLDHTEYAKRYIVQQCKERSVAPEQIGDDEIKMALAEQILRSPVFAARNFFATTTKTQEVRTIDPWIGQLLFDMVCESQRKNGYAQRVVEIKPRQVGYTTWLIARGMWHALQPNASVVFMVPDDEVTKNLNKRIADVYNNLGWMTPMRRIENQGRVVFSNPDSRTRDWDKGLESQIVVTVPGPIRGFSPTFVVLSEFAHYRDISSVDPSDMLTGLLSGMSAGAESAVFIDTTPNSFDEDYYPLVQEAMERNPKWVRAWERKTIPTREEIISGAFGQPDRPGAGWVPVFTSSVWHENYRTQDEHPLGQLKKLTKEQHGELVSTLGKLAKYGCEQETELQKRYGATLGYLFWRRWKLDNDIQGYDHRQRLLTFSQEYAVSPNDAFIDFGNQAFDGIGLATVTRMARPPVARGILRSEYDGKNVRTEWTIDQTWNSPWEEMRFWAPPGNDQFVMGVDLGESFENDDADQTYACVLRRRDLKQVAVYEACAPHHRTRQALYAMYRYFNNAYTAVEVDAGGGKNLVRELYDMGLRNQYHWKRLDTEIVEDTKFLGWETSEQTRPRMDGAVVEMVGKRDENDHPAPGFILRDKKTIDQMLTLKRDPNGKLKARGGAHDDAYIALAIALMADRDPVHPFVAPRRVQERALEGVLYTYQRLMSGQQVPERNRPRLQDM